MAKYIVRQGDTVFDACLNVNGSIATVMQVLDLNGLKSYSPIITAGTVLTMPDKVINDDVINAANAFPFNSTPSIPRANVMTMINNLITELNNI